MYSPITVKNASTGERKAHPIVEFKASVRKAAHDAYDGEPLTGPVRVDALFLMPRTSAMIWKTKPMPRAWHVSKPDKDNIEKGLLDALKGRLWRDDSQVCAGLILKMYAAGDEQPGVFVTVSELEITIERLA